MDKCDICRKPSAYQLLRKIETDWDGTYKMVCASCITERGRYAIACRFDRPRHLQDDAYKAQAFPPSDPDASAPAEEVMAEYLLAYERLGLPPRDFNDAPQTARWNQAMTPRCQGH